MNKQIFVNLPVKNLEKSKAFFAALGYTFNPQFTDENAASMVIHDGSIYAMLLVEDFFRTFTAKPIANAKEATEVLVCLSCEKAAMRSTTWCAKPLRQGARRRASRKTMDSCTRTGSKTWTAISGSWSTWPNNPSSNTFGCCDNRIESRQISSLN